MYSSTTEFQRASLTILPTVNYNPPSMGHKIPYLSSLLVTCHQSNRLYGVTTKRIALFVWHIRIGPRTSRKYHFTHMWYALNSINISYKQPKNDILHQKNVEYYLTLFFINRMFIYVLWCLNTYRYNYMCIVAEIPRGERVGSTALPVLMSRSWWTQTLKDFVIRDLESIDHLCINPIRRIGLIYKWSDDSL